LAYGSVRFIGYELDVGIHRILASINGPEIVGLPK
jgi:hypothetical protein